MKLTRPVQDNIPASKQQRERILAAAREYVRQQSPAAPLSFAELRGHCENMIASDGIEKRYLDFLAVLLNNATWEKAVAAIPFNKRLLLLPKCVHHIECPAKMDELGLLCQQCGRCIVGELKGQAEELGFAVLVAEGSPVVMSLIASGKVDAVIGISCLSVLEKTQPYMEAGAVPGIAIPLLYDGCADTAFDVDWVVDAIYSCSDEDGTRLDMDRLRGMVNDWFGTDSLEKAIAPGNTETEKLAVEWLTRQGKRWRPFLAASAYEAISANGLDNMPADVRKMCIAVECFHKASLIHDDIEDGDEFRYGQKTLHAEFGVPIALNVGDFLVGEGYRLLSQLDANADKRVRMLTVAAEGHRNLCLGQGQELLSLRTATPSGVDDMIDIFRCKTSPAFAVALKLGSILAGADGKLSEVLAKYSDALGVAYQIRDDLDDLYANKTGRIVGAGESSIIISLAYEKADAEAKNLIESLWTGKVKYAEVSEQIDNIFAECRVELAARGLMEVYKGRTLSCLGLLDSSSLKSLLRRVICKIFYDIEIMGCCDDYQAGHDDSSEGGNGTAG